MTEETRDPPRVAKQQESGADTRDKVAEKRLSDETRMALAISDIEERLYKLPVNIAFGALATLAGRLVVASHRTNEDLRRNNRHVFVRTLDTVIGLEEAKQAREARIRQKVEQLALDRQRAEPLKPIDRKELERQVRSQFHRDELREQQVAAEIMKPVQGRA